MNGRMAVILSILIFAPSLFSQQTFQDVVYLKDGSVIRGTILEQIHNVSLKIQTQDGNIFIYKMEEVRKIVKEPYQKPSKTTIIKEKSPLTSFLLSFFIVGVGQYYNGQVLKGLTLQAGFLGGILMLGRNSDSNNSGTLNSSELLGSFIMMGSWAVSIIDAPMSSDKINETRQQSYGHLIELHQGDNLIGLDIGCLEGILTSRIIYHF